MKKLWICGKFIELTNVGIVWDFQGIFSKEKKAIDACRNENYFIGPVYLNKEIPDERIEWPECYYPKR